MKTLSLFYRFLLCSSVVCASLLGDNLHAQDTTKTSSALRFGIIGGMGLTQHAINFAEFPEFPLFTPRTPANLGPGNFSDASLFSPTFGGLVEMPLSPSIVLGVRGLIGTHGVNLTTSEPTFIGTATGQFTDALITYSLRTKQTSLTIEPTIGYRITNALTVHGGLRGMMMLSSSFEQDETITPNDPSFSGGFNLPNLSRVRNPQSGSIPNASALLFGAVGGVSYEIPLTPSLALAPEVMYAVHFNPVVSGLSWNMNVLRAGVALKFGSTPVVPPPPAPVIIQPRDTTPVVIAQDIKKEEPKKEEPIVPPPPPAKPKLTASLDITDANNNRNYTIKLEEFRRFKLEPLLNYVFFDEGSADLPARYQRVTTQGNSAPTFREEDVFALNTLPIYYHVLNIIGYRMTKNPKEVIRIIGCNDGVSAGEKDNQTLSRQRAEAVRNYLRNVWQISDNRLRLEVRNLPEKPSGPVTEQDAKEENRRVEIVSTSNAWEIMRPVLINDTLRTMTPDILNVIPKVEAERGLQSWQMTMKWGTEVLKTMRGTGTMMQTQQVQLAEDIARVMVQKGGSQAITFELAVVDNTNQQAVASSDIPVAIFRLQTSVSSTVYDRYRLILFDFNTSTLSWLNQRISQILRNRITATSRIRIAGYTDRSGSDEANKKLSKERAEQSGKSLPQKNIVEIKGVGEESLLYDNTIPEGRFYCRTVEIDMTTEQK